MTRSAALENEIREIRQNLEDQHSLVDQLSESLGLETPDPQKDIRPIRDSEIVRAVSDNLSDFAIGVCLEIVKMTLGTSQFKYLIAENLDLSDQYLETLESIVSDIMDTDKVKK